LKHWSGLLKYVSFKYTVVKHSSDSFLIQNDLKKEDNLSPLLLNFDSGYVIKNVQQNQAGLKFNETHHLLTYAVDVNLLGDNIETINRETETIIDAGKEVGLEVNVEKTKYMFVSRDQNADQNLDIIIANK
jgi:hypothetical protein